MKITVTTSDLLDKYISKFKEDMPKDLDMQPIYNDAFEIGMTMLIATITESIENTRLTMTD